MGARKVCVAVFRGLECVKLQCKPSEHPSIIRMVMRLAIELAGKPYDLSASSNANRITKRLADGYTNGPRCVFSALDYGKSQCGPFEHPSASRLVMRIALELAGKPYDLSTSTNANRTTKRLADRCSKGLRCVFSALNCVKLQCGPSEHPSVIRITIRLALELVGKPYADVYSEVLHYNFTRSKPLKTATQTFRAPIGKPYENPSAIRMVMRIAIELAGKPYDLSASFNANHITKRLADGCSDGPHCVFNALYYVKSQRRPFEHPSASRLVMRLALELASKPYDLLFFGKSYGLPTSSNASRMVIRIADGCSKVPRCNVAQFKALKTQCGSFEHPSASRLVVRLAIELAGKPYKLSASSNANRITKRLADGCSEDPHCIFSALDYVKSQRGPFEHPSANCLVMRLALKLGGKSYELSASSNASRTTKRLADVCLKGLRCVFNALNYVKLQRGSFEHPSASRITIRLALELAEHPSANRMIMRFAIELAGKSYNFSASFNANRLPIGARKVHVAAFSALDCVKRQPGHFEHPSANCMIMRLAIELVGKPYDLSASSNANRITKRLANGYSEGPRCVLSALDYVKSQRGPSKHSSASRLVMRLALELAGKSYNLLASSNAIRITRMDVRKVRVAFSVL
ncbi:hypothetical protein L7F22_012131 [Adiantum nelumboides]|nr:hypothetical protein [Adiantum nelumboides]